jgi:protein TonB
MPEVNVPQGPSEHSPDVHLERLLTTETQKSFLVSLIENLKETLAPAKLPPLQVTSKPVAVKSIWGFTGGQGSRAGASSMVIHASVVALMFALSTNEMVQQKMRETITLVAPDIEAYKPAMQPKKQEMGGGGGGGDRSPLPASKGKLPKIAPRQFVPPAAVVHNENPKLLMEPTIIAQADAPIPNVNMPNWGDPFGKVGPPSNGPGSGGGIGSGRGGGVGSGDGAGVGPGRGGGFGGGAYRIGGGVSSPIPISRVEPEYSEEARKAKFMGTVVLALIVDERGLPKDVRVVRAVGLGLDEKAIEAVLKWRFRPGYLNGNPVPVHAQIEVNFRLL